MPVRMTLLPSTSTLIRSASVRGVRTSASSIFCFSSDGEAWGFTLIRFTTPLTPVRCR